jgi:hypothetical protein
MKDKIQVQQQRSVYTFSTSEIAKADVRDFLAGYDPVRLSNRRLEKLFGRVIIRFEGITEGEVPTHPQLRPLLRRLHAIWPWAGFFLDLKQPLGPKTGINQLPLQAFGLCVADVKLGFWHQTDQVHFSFGPQLRRFYDNCHEVVDRLGKRASLSKEALQARHEAVCRQFNDILT